MQKQPLDEWLCRRYIGTDINWEEGSVYEKISVTGTG